MSQEKATARPWLWFKTDQGYSVCSSGGPCEDHFVPDPHCHKCVVFDGVTAADAALICTAVNERDALLSKVAQLREALEDANELCRSALAIAQREGLQTNWTAFTEQLKDSVKRQHEAMYARAALAGKEK